MKNVNIKHCPFCGGEARLEDMGYPHHVYCTECSARITGRGYGEEGELDAVARWNTRVRDEALYMEGYENGRKDEAGLRDGTILQTFSPD